MSKVLRIVVLVLVLGAVGWFVREVTRGEVPQIPDAVPSLGAGGGGAGGAAALSNAPRVFTSSQECAECHREIYDEWKASFHGQAWTDPEYQLLRNEENSQDCIPCHAPKPAALTGIGNRFLARYDRRGEGVDCFTCHQTDKGMIGPIPDPQPAPCSPVYDLSIRKMDLCYPCHNQHDTHKEWEASDWFKKGDDCNSCHMPSVERPVATGGEVRKGSRHDWLGGHHPAYVRTSFEFEAREAAESEGLELFQGLYGVDVPDPLLLGITRLVPLPEAERIEPPSGTPRVYLRVKNVGAGHNVPTDSRNNTIDLVLRVSNEEGAEVLRILVDRFRNPYRNEITETRVNTQIPSGAERAYLVALPIDKGSWVCRLLYKSGPFDEDDKAVVLFEEKGSF